MVGSIYVFIVRSQDIRTNLRLDLFLTTENLKAAT